MSRIAANLPVATPARHAFSRKLALIWAIGTLMPLVVLAVFYVLAPLPMTAATMDILHTVNRIAGAVVLVHWGITLAVWATSKVVKTAPRHATTTQNIKLVRRATA